MAAQQSNPFAMSNDWAASYIPKRNQDYKHPPKLRWVKPQVGGSPTSDARTHTSRMLRLRDIQKNQKSLRTEAGMAARNLQGLHGTSEATFTVKSTGVRQKSDAKKAAASRYLVRKKNKNTSRAMSSKTPRAVPLAKPTEYNNNVAVAEERKRTAFELTSPTRKKELAIDHVYIRYSMKMTETAMYLMQNLSSWTTKLEAYADFIPASVAGEMTSAVGMSKLLVDSKIPQFANLLNLYLIREDAVKPVLVSDLQGWWDAFDVEFGKLKFSFSVLQQMQGNNWQPLDSERFESENHISTVDAKKTTNKGITKTQPRKSSPAVLQFLAGKREEMRQSVKLGQEHPEVIFVTSSSKDSSNPQPGPSKEDVDTAVSTPPRALNSMPLETEFFCTPGGNLNENLLGRTTSIDSPGDTIHYARLKKKLQAKPRLSREGSRRASMAMLALGNALDQTSQKTAPNSSDSNAGGNAPPETITFASALEDTFTRARNNFKIFTSAVSRSRWNPWK